MRILNKFFAIGLMSLGLALVVVSQPVDALSHVAQIDPFGPCAGVTDSSVCNAAGSGGRLFGPGSIWNNILNILTFVLGAIAVLMIIIGAFRYALSSGDQANITSAKNTIIYALVALIVAVMANAIVNFVLTTI